MEKAAPFILSVENPKPDLQEMHFTFTQEFRDMTVEQRLESLHAYGKTLIDQGRQFTDANSQKGIMTVLEILEQLFPHIQSGSLPLNETLVVEMGDGAEGSSLNELLG